MRDLELLAERHFELCHSESPSHRAELMIWYADVAVSVDGSVVNYRCPECGRPTTANIEEFVQHETRGGLLCEVCRGEAEERGGALD